MAKPASTLDWTVGNPSFGTVTQEPSAGVKLAGYSPNARPPAQNLNWLFWIIDSWIKYFDTVFSQGVAAQYDAVVASSGGTHTTLAAALAAVNPNARIYVKSDLTVTSPVQVTKNGVRIEFAPLVTISKGGSAADAIQISANDVRVENGRFSGFIAGGNAGILIDATSLRSRILNCNFVNCTSNISDLEGATGVELGTITE